MGEIDHWPLCCAYRDTSSYGPLLPSPCSTLNDQDYHPLCAIFISYIMSSTILVLQPMLQCYNYQYFLPQCAIQSMICIHGCIWSCTISLCSIYMFNHTVWHSCYCYYTFRQHICGFEDHKILHFLNMYHSLSLCVGFNCPYFHKIFVIASPFSLV